MMDGLLWVEKYRPKTLEDMALSDGNRKLFQSYIDAGEFPHLLLTGPAGCGKTTVSRILTEEIDCAVLSLNASKERGIDTVRDKIGTFARGRMGTTWNAVFLDEADALTRDAQTALRNLMEQFSNKTRFILTANYPYRIIDPIRSRCVEVGMQEIPLGFRARVLADVFKAEGIEADPEIIFSYAERYTDLRRLLTRSQRSFLSHGELRPAQDLSVTGEDLFKAILEDDWNFLTSATKSADFDHRQSLEDLFWAIPDDFERAATFRVIVGKAVHESGFTPDPVILCLTTFSELITELP